MSILFLDLETRSTVDLRKHGVRRYAASKDTDILLAAWSLDFGPIQQWDRFADEHHPYKLRALLENPAVRKSAFNAPFEMNLLRGVWGVPIDPRQWQCTKAWAYSRAFTGTLAQVGAAMGLPTELLKQEGGSKLIQRFSLPRRPSRANPRLFWEPQDDEEKWQQFKEYNRQDVVAEMAIARKLWPHPWSPGEHERFCWDFQVNERGLPIDTRFARNAISVARNATDRALDRIADITGLDNPNSRDQVLAWVQDNGVRVNDLTQETIERVLLDPFEDERVREVLTLRAAVSQAAVKKYNAVLDRQMNDRLQDTLQVWGAGRTGRWSGQGFQLQNLKRPPHGIDPTAIPDLIES